MLTPLHYISELEDPNQAVICEYLHGLLCTFPEIRPLIKFNIPFYYGKKWICYLNPVKNSGVELAFTRANEFENARPLLEFRDRKLIGGLIFYKKEEIQEEMLIKIILEALELDGRTSMRAPKKRGG